jgi:alpha-galactosidase
MMGKMGFDIVVEHLNSDELQFAQTAIQNYNKLKNNILQGDQYRLFDPYTHDFASLMYVSTDKNKAVMFNYWVSNRYESTASPKPVVQKGLNPNKKYKIQEINLFGNKKSSLNSNAEYSGSYLMTVGYNPEVNSGRSSVILEIGAV